MALVGSSRTKERLQSKDYHVRYRVGILAEAVGSFLGAAFALSFARFFVTVIATSQELFLLVLLFLTFGFALGILFLYHTWSLIARMPYRILVHTNGEIEFHRMYRNAVVDASHVKSIDKTFGFGGKEADTRVIVVRHSAGSVPIRHFSEAEDFIAELLKMNLSISVTEHERYYE